MREGFHHKWAQAHPTTQNLQPSPHYATSKPLRCRKALESPEAQGTRILMTQHMILLSDSQPRYLLLHAAGAPT